MLYNFVSYNTTSAKTSFGSNFGNIRAVGSNRFWCYFLVHTFKIKKVESISSNGSRDIAKSLKISFGSSFVSLRAFGSKFWQYTPFKQKNALDYLYPFLSFSVHNFCARTDGRTGGQTFFEKVLFFLADQEYIYMFIPISSISFPMEMGMKILLENRIK